MMDDSSPPPFVIFYPPAPSERVYRQSLELVEHVHAVLEQADAARYHLKDKLDRLTTEIAVGLKRAANEAKHDAWRSYRQLIVQVDDCATLLDVLGRKARAAELPVTGLDAARTCVKQLSADLMPLALRRDN